jgi:hypothetical protein
MVIGLGILVARARAIEAAGAQPAARDAADVRAAAGTQLPPTGLVARLTARLVPRLAPRLASRLTARL